MREIDSSIFIAFIERICILGSYRPEVSVQLIYRYEKTGTNFLVLHFSFHNFWC